MQVGEPLHSIGEGLFVDLRVFRPNAVADSFQFRFWRGFALEISSPAALATLAAMLAAVVHFSAFIYLLKPLYVVE
jgi:hypothetical protein